MCLSGSGTGRGGGFGQEWDADSARNREQSQSAEREDPYSIRLEGMYGWRTGLSPLSLPDLPLVTVDSHRVDCGGGIKTLKMTLLSRKEYVKCLSKRIYFVDG
jgi:hypothetical protein